MMLCLLQQNKSACLVENLPLRIGRKKDYMDDIWVLFVGNFSTTNVRSIMLKILYVDIYIVWICIFKDLRAKAMVKPGLAHEHSYEFTLIQRKIRVWFRTWFRVWIRVWIRIIQSLIQSLNQSLNQRISEPNVTWTDSESVLNCFWKTSWFSTELLWKLGTGRDWTSL